MQAYYADLVEFLVTYKMLKDPLVDEEDRQNILLPSFRRKKTQTSYCDGPRRKKMAAYLDHVIKR